jgi:lipopolysaccharide transport system ATP-binding protein
MHEVATEGRTVIFVSHNMSAIQSLCTRGIVLRSGKLGVDAPVDQAIREYLSYLHDTAKDAFTEENPERRGKQTIRMTGGCILGEDGQPTQHLIAGKPATVEVMYENPGSVRQVDLYFTIFNHLGIAAAHCATTVSGEQLGPAGSEGKLTCRLANVALPAGQYLIALSLHGDGSEKDLIPNALVFDISSSVFYKTGRMPPMQFSAALLDYEWEHQAAESTASLRG